MKFLMFTVFVICLFCTAFGAIGQWEVDTQIFYGTVTVVALLVAIDCKREGSADGR